MVLMKESSQLSPVFLLDCGNDDARHGARRDVGRDGDHQVTTLSRLSNRDVHRDCNYFPHHHDGDGDDVLRDSPTCVLNVHI